MAGQLIKPPSLIPMQVLMNQRQRTSDVRGVTSDEWFSALEPLHPVAPLDMDPRQFEYMPGQNLVYQPRADEPISYQDLIYMSENCDLVRIVIECLKDQLCLLPWQVRAKAEPGESEKERKQRTLKHNRVKHWSKFLQNPNPEMGWSDFLRMLLEDLFVLDAPSILLQKNRKGDIGALRVIDGQTITRVIDDYGFTPLPPNPAYQQILYGQPAVNLTTDDLIYRPRNRRARKIYGYSPVEQILLTLNVAVRRQRFQLNFYTEGNIPEALYTMPASVTDDQVKKFQGWFDQSLAGNLAHRRRIWFIPGDDKGVQRLHWTKEQALKDDCDEWLARIICFAFRISPMEFVRMMNRATAETSQDAAQEMGVQSVCQWVADTLNHIIQQKAGDDDIEFVFTQKREPDILKQAQVDQIYVNSGIRTRNEVRENIGDEPANDSVADMLTISGVITSLDAAVQAGSQQLEPARGVGQTKDGHNPNQPYESNQPDIHDHVDGATPKSPDAMPNPKQNNQQKVRQVRKSALLVSSLDGALNQHEITLTRTLVSGFFQAEALRAADRVLALEPDLEKAKKPKPTAEEVIKAATKIDYTPLVAPLENSLFAAGSTGATIGVSQMDVADMGVIANVSTGARNYARKRAAEMIGKQWKGGRLVENPNAEFRIDLTTRKEIRELVEKAFAKDTPLRTLAEQIRQAGAFSESRAQTIARTEIARAQSYGTMAVWQQIGTVKTTIWTTSANEGVCDECVENELAGPVELGKAFPSGDIAPPSHPNCRCALMAYDLD